MTLKPDAGAVAAAAGKALPFPPAALTDASVSADYLIAMRSGMPRTGVAPTPVDRVSEHELREGVRVRVYAPIAEKPLPVLVFLHGGGWVSGDLDQHDPTCRILANEVPAVVVNVDYRLAPEHKFPEPLFDAWAATLWARDHASDYGGDPARMAVLGVSSGGNLAAGVALRSTFDNELELALSVLICPVIDSRMDTDSFRDNATGYLLQAGMMEWFWQQYVASDADRQNPLASPSYAEDLSGLPPSIVLTAEYDPLRDEAEAYAERLSAAGVPTMVRRTDGQIHGFMGLLGVIADAEPSLMALVGELRDRLG